ncbi:membrane dipeptidase [Nocardia barduliensis]|uniref:membrane dipeptidase n=1 Tax=Nocardia barduliensis TaxID=2736643 RepID=UPI001FE433C6|nr:membrane dipeptidase [Nocardia barduliensis]
MRGPIGSTLVFAIIIAICSDAIELPPTGEREPATTDAARQLADRSELPGVGVAGKLVGMIDAHAHLTAAEAFGGALRCGRPFAEGGTATALAPCPEQAGTQPGSLLEAVIGGGAPVPDGGGGWPGFESWPRHDTVLHEQAQIDGIERAWRAGLRVVNTLLVANRVICELSPQPRHHACDEMEEIHIQANYLRAMQDHVDAAHGGPGRGWFRIATTPEQVRSIAAQGKLAVIIGVENSELFGCREIRDVAQCTVADIDRGLDEMQALGVSNLFPIHKFDNAFGGTRFDPGLAGAAINVGNLLTTGHWWQAESCTGAADHEQLFADSALSTLLAGGATGLPSGTAVPVYPSGPVCNIRGLTALGRHLVHGMIARGMVINIDHMSVRAARDTLEIAEAAGYPGIISAHTWADREMVDRVLALGGFVASYAYAAADAGDGEPDFLSEWRANTSGPHGDRVTGYGYGSDVNGLAALAAPRLDAAQRPLSYPFRAPNGVEFDRQRVGDRVYDLNVDGVAQYGLYADWYADVIRTAGDDGDELARELMNGAEAFVAMWESARR